MVKLFVPYVQELFVETKMSLMRTSIRAWLMNLEDSKKKGLEEPRKIVKKIGSILLTLCYRMVQ
jgi:hypothetical protein